MHQSPHAPDALPVLQEQIYGCHRCVDAGYLTHANPIAGARGNVTDRIMLIGQAPGRLSVERQLPFGGPGGIILDQWLTRAGFSAGALRRQIYLTALTRCFPGKHPTGKGDRVPSPAEIALCRPWLAAELALINPPMVLLVGKLAIETMLQRKGSLAEWVGQCIQQHERCWLPLPHPSGVSRWLNVPEHQALLAQGLALLSDWRAANLPDIDGVTTISPTRH